MIETVSLAVQESPNGAPVTLDPPVKEGTWDEGGPRDPRNHPAARAATILDAKNGCVRIHQSRVALTGFSVAGRLAGPYDDPTWGITALNQLYRFSKRVDLHYEIHERAVFEADMVRDTDYVGWLRACPIPIMMLDLYPDIPNGVRYPVEEINAWIGPSARDYLTSTPAYMAAYVVWSKAMGINPHLTEIGVWGIDLIVGEEYDYQKPCMEFWLGVARGAGMALTIHEKSSLLKTLQRYGLSSGHVTFGPFTHARFQTKIEQMEKRKQEIEIEKARIEGAQWAMSNYDNMLTIAERCGTVLSVEEQGI